MKRNRDGFVPNMLHSEVYIYIVLGGGGVQGQGKGQRLMGIKVV